MARLTLTVSERQAGRTAGSLLKHELGLSTTCVNRLKRSETGLLLDGQRVFTNAVVRAGQVLEANLGEAERTSRITPIAMDLHILFEDEHLLVLDKPAPLAVIPSSLSPGEPTLANGLAHYLGEGFSFHPVNRLDRGTTGVMAVPRADTSTTSCGGSSTAEPFSGSTWPCVWDTLGHSRAISPCPSDGPPAPPSGGRSIPRVKRQAPTTGCLVPGGASPWWS